MEAKDKKLAEAVLRHLCKGAQIDGIRFGPVLQMLISDKGPPLRGQVYLNLVSNWGVFDALTTSFPGSEDELPEMTEEEQIRQICDLRELTIAKIELGDPQPHLIVTLEDGQVLFVNGRHDMYECWQLGISRGDPQEHWLLVACPGEGIAIWAPNDFDFTDK